MPLVTLQFILTCESINFKSQKMILKKWLEMIFGGKGDQVVQKMQEWSQKKLNDLFDREKAVAFLPDNVDFDGQLDQEGRKQGKAILTWREDNHGKAVLEGFFHQDELVGNIHIKHLGIPHCTNSYSEYHHLLDFLCFRHRWHFTMGRTIVLQAWYSSWIPLELVPNQA